LGLTQEEYIILTREAFWPKRYFDLAQKTTFSEVDYEKKIGVRDVWEYYGYRPGAAGKADMLSLDETPDTGQKGLTFVKTQFLPRTGIQYTDLVELLKTQFINPNFPQGKALTILESIRFSYRFLQTLVDGGSKDPKIRFAKLIAFLEKWQPLVPWINARLHPDPCKQQTVDLCAEREDFRNWVYCYFEQIGQLIVLESGEGPQLPIEGELFRAVNVGVIVGVPPVGTLHKDGTIVDTNGNSIGNVTFDGYVLASNGDPFLKHYHVGIVLVFDKTNQIVGLIIPRGLFLYPGQQDFPVTWLPPRDTCDLDKVRLVHLDGTSLMDPEYDRIHRFIRLWRKLGWTIDETDKALIGLAATPGDTTVPAVCDYVDFASISCAGSEISADCECGPVQTWACPDIPQVDYDITPDFLHQLRAVKKLLDQTGLPLPKLLAFWAEISTAGEKSLYAKLFLTHNRIRILSVRNSNT
jgi:hypothetical protein